MVFKQPIKILLLGLILWVYLSPGVGQTSVMAAGLLRGDRTHQEWMQPQPENTVDLESDLEHFLATLPAGYYTISSVAGLKDLKNSEQIVLVDVRERSEYQAGHIPNAINIPLRTLTQNLDKIAHDRPVVVYCSTGYRSAMGVMALHLLGYENVQGFPLSFAGWKAAGEAIAKS